MMYRLAGCFLVSAVLVCPLGAQTGDVGSETMEGANPSERPDISWWDSDYWAEWEAERRRWRSDWLDYEDRHPGRVSRDLARVIRGGTPTPHRIDGGAAALAELDYGVEPGTFTRELRWLAGSPDFRGGMVWANRGDEVGQHMLRDLLDARLRSMVSRRRTRDRLDRVGEWYRSLFDQNDQVDRRQRDHAEVRDRRDDGNRSGFRSNRRTTRRGGN